MGVSFPSLSGVFSVVFIAVMILPLFTAWFCLFPNKVEFDLQFSGDDPIKVKVVASGNMLSKFESEYSSFLQALNPSYGDGGIGLL